MDVPIRNPDEENALPRRRQMARVEDVARLAGVSTATVDRVLNQRPGVRLATVQRVLKAAGELGVLMGGDTVRLEAGDDGATALFIAGRPIFGTLIALARASGLAALIATHNMDLAGRMDRVIRLGG